MAVTTHVKWQKRFDWRCHTCQRSQTDTVAGDRPTGKTGVKCDLCDQSWTIQPTDIRPYVDIITIRVVG